MIFALFTKSLSLKTVISGFKVCGVCPFNRKALTLPEEQCTSFNPLYPKFPAERLAVSGSKNRGATLEPAPSLALAFWGAGLVGGRWINNRRDGAANDIHKWPHPKKVGTKLTFDPLHSTTLTRLT